MEPVLTRLPRKVVGVERNAVSAQARTRIECGKPIGLRLGSVNNFPHIDTHAVAQHGHLIHQADIHVAVSILQDLLHLSHGRTRHLGHATFEHRLV